MYERPAVTKPTARRVAAAAGRTVVLGGGVGGLVAARELRRVVFRQTTEVVLVDRAAEHVYQPSLLWQMVGERRPSQFTRPLDRLQRKGIEFHHAEAEALDLDDRVVVTAAGELDYDSLIVSLGAQLAPETGERVRRDGLQPLQPGGVRAHPRRAPGLSPREWSAILIPAHALQVSRRALRSRVPRGVVPPPEGDPSQRRDPPVHARAPADAGRACRARRLDRRHARRPRHPLPPTVHLPGASARDARDRRLRWQRAPGRPADGRPAPSGT